MKNPIQNITMSLLIAAGLTSCAGLGSMLKKYDKMVSYEVKPNPLEMHGDTVMVNVSGKYNPKYFAKKVTLTITPVIKYNGGEKALKPVEVQGEKVKEGKGKVIVFKDGGSFSYTDRTGYISEMKNCELVVKITGKQKSKTKDFPEKKIADGTIITPLLVKNDDKPLLGKDNFQKTYPVTQKTEIFFLVNMSDVRASEIKGKSMTATQKFIEEKRIAKGFVFKGATVSAYASPDGELSFNANLAKDRAKSTVKYYSNLAKQKAKDKNPMLPGADAENFYTTVTTAEDWDGFKTLMQQSNIKDKELILRVLEMYSDVERREKEIKNLSATYNEIREQILPKLRRSIITWNCEQQSRPDNEILQLATLSPDSLANEEILYAATLTNDINTKLSIYKNADRLYGATDWRCSNNVGYCNILLNKPGDAQTALDKAKGLNNNAPEVMNNLGILARWKGDRKTAMEYYNKAGSSAEVNHNKGIVNIRDGKYADAVTNFGSENSFNSALAKVLNGNGDGALTTLDASPEKEDALSYYLKAIVGARKGNTDLLINNLKIAINKDASFKSKAKEDMEFFKYRENADFKALVG
jgi:tetratricopeptide (TPR) repeat protein